MGISRKGFVFTYDALIAVALALLFLNLFLIVSRPRGDTFNSLLISRKASDLLVAGEKSGTFGTKDNDTIFVFMNQTLAGNIHAELNMKIYNRTLDITDEFNVSRTDGSSPSEYTIARRVIPIYESGNLTEVGLVTLMLWMGDFIE